MKAFQYHRYGGPEELSLTELPKPSPKDDEVLIKVYAVSLNASDWEFLTGKPFYARIHGLTKPRKKILGSDVAGIVEAVGKKVKQFQPGDEVFGDILNSMGGFAEYVCAPAKYLHLKPTQLSFEQAAALPQAALIALQGIRDKKKLSAGSKVLINGAGGGSGSLAIQLAKRAGAEVTGVDNGLKQDFMQSNGADHVVDYQKEDPTRQGRNYDLILDLVAYRPPGDWKRVLKPEGVYAAVGGSVARLLQTIFMGIVSNVTEKKRMGILAVNPKSGDMEYMLDLFRSGKINLLIDKQFLLEDLPQALQYLGDGKAKGKVVVSMVPLKSNLSFRNSK